LNEPSGFFVRVAKPIGAVVFPVEFNVPTDVFGQISGET
jgi:hypothetical protein